MFMTRCYLCWVENRRPTLVHPDRPARAEVGVGVRQALACWPRITTPFGVRATLIRGERLVLPKALGARVLGQEAAAGRIVGWSRALSDSEAWFSVIR